MLKPNLMYTWEMETANGEIRSQYDESGVENTWKTLPLEKIMRVSFLPAIPLLPRHDVFINPDNGEKFIKRFGRGFLKQKKDGIKLREYLNCVVTNKYRFWVFSTGRTMVTEKDREVYI